MGEFLKEILGKRMELASQVTKAADESALRTHECHGCTLIKPKTQNLEELIHKLIALQRIQYDRPILRIMDEVDNLLGKALTFVLTCGGSNKRHRNDRDDDDASAKFSMLLDNCIEDVKWLSYLYEFSYDRLIYSCPPIARREERALAMIWICIKELCDNSHRFRLLAAQDLLSFTVSGNNPGVKKLIIEEGGVLPLLKLLKDGNIEEQEAAAEIMESLPHNLKSVEQLIVADGFPVFAKILKVGSMKVQTKVVSIIGNLANIHPKCLDLCVQNNIVRLLIEHISSEMRLEHVQNFVPINKATSVLAIVSASSRLNKAKTGDGDNLVLQHSNSQLTNRQLKDTKAFLKAKAASALQRLVQNNTAMCWMIAESKALMCFIKLLAEGPEAVRFHSLMILRDITAVAEKDSDLRRSVFKPSSPPWKPLITNIIHVIERSDLSFIIFGGYPSPYIVILCVQIIGNLARTFRMVETRIIGELVEFIHDKKDQELCTESWITLTKLTSEESHLHVDHSKEIVRIGGLSCIIQVIKMGDASVRESGIVLFCSIVRDVDGIGRIEALKVLKQELKVLEQELKKCSTKKDEIIRPLPRRINVSDEFLKEIMN